jgi:uncharacterized SAM-binding protein YcdF (DUF218 family)
LLPDGTPPPWVLARLDACLLEEENARALMPLSGLSLHKAPPLDARGRPIPEAVAAAQYLIEHGAPAEKIFVEAASLDTIGNAYFARMIHTDPRGWRKLLVINSDFHMPRTQLIFRWVFGLGPLSQPYELTFKTTPSEQLQGASRMARFEREEESIRILSPIIEQCQDLSSLHQWLFTQHGAYAAKGREPEELDNHLLIGY